MRGGYLSLFSFSLSRTRTYRIDSQLRERERVRVCTGVRVRAVAASEMSVVHQGVQVDEGVGEQNFYLVLLSVCLSVCHRRGQFLLRLSEVRGSSGWMVDSCTARKKDISLFSSVQKNLL